MLQSILTSVVASIFLDTAKKMSKEFRSPLKRALEDTSIFFSKQRGIEINTKRLAHIIDGEFAQHFSKNYFTDTGTLEYKTFLLEFAENADIFFEDENRMIEVAADILEYYAHQFERHILNQDHLKFFKSYLDKQFRQINENITRQLMAKCTESENRISDIIKKELTSILKDNVTFNNPPIQLHIHLNIENSRDSQYVSIETGDNGVMSNGIEYDCPGILSILGYRDGNDIILLDHCEENEKDENKDNINAIIESIENEYLCFYQILSQNPVMKWVENVLPQDIDDITVPIKISHSGNSPYILLLDDDEDQLKNSSKNLLERLNEQRNTVTMDSTIILIVYIQEEKV